MGIVKDKTEKPTIKQRFAKLRQDMKDMTWKEKLEHIWEYYRYTMLVVLCVVLIVGGLIYGILVREPELNIGGVQCNMELTVEGYDYLTSTFQKEVLGKDDGKSTLNTFWFYGSPTEESISDNYRAHSSVTAYVETQNLDYMLVDMFSFAHFAGDRLFMDLREILTEEELAALDAMDLLLYEDDVTTNKRTPTAINIVDSPFVQENAQVAECYLVFIRNTPRKETCRKFWAHIKNYGGKTFPKQKPLCLGGAQCNVELTEEAGTYLTTTFQGTAPEMQDGRVRFTKYTVGAEDTQDQIDANRLTRADVTGDIEKKKLDYMLMDQQAFDYFAPDQLYMDLREILTEEELAELEAQSLLMYAQEIPVAVNITDYPFVQKHSETETCYLVFMKGTERKDACIKIWEHINNF